MHIPIALFISYDRGQDRDSSYHGEAVVNKDDYTPRVPKLCPSVGMMTSDTYHTMYRIVAAEFDKILLMNGRW